MQSLNNIVTWINESETQEDVFFQRNKTVESYNNNFKV